MNAEKTSDPKSLETEIVIVGGGGAGLAAGSDTGDGNRILIVVSYLG